MNFIYPSVELIDEPDNIKRIELAGRTCYKSESKITDDSAFPFFQRIIKRGHTSVLEHSVIFVRTHTPEACMKLKQLLVEYVEATGYPSYIRYSQYDNDYHVSDPTDVEFENGFHLGMCIGKEHLFSGNIRAWRKLCEAYNGEPILQDTFSSHIAFQDIFANSTPEEHVYTSDDIEIVDSIETNPDKFPDAYKHMIATIRIISDRGIIDEYCRHRSTSISVESTRYCVAGDTVIKTSNDHKTWTIDQLYNNMCNSKNGAWKKIQFKTYNKNSGEFEYATANNILYNGTKKCITIKTKLGYSLTCTPDHSVLTPNGYIEADSFSIGDLICVNGTELLYRNKDWLYYQNITLNKTFVQISKEFNFNISTLKKWARIHGLPKKGTGYFNVGHTPWNKGIQDPRQVEALRKYHHSGIHDNRTIIKPDTSKYMKHNSGVCAICGSTEGLDVHHIDKNHNNHDPQNLMTLCQSCHKRVHSNNLQTIYNDTIVSIEDAGEHKVYDITINSDNHNYVANGVVVHNCNYSDKGLTFVFPYWYEHDKLREDRLNSQMSSEFVNRCYDTELAYQEWMKKTNTPQSARGNLILWTKSEGVFTATIQQWIDILALRDSQAAHPDARKIAKMIEKVLVEQVGVKDIWGVAENGVE